MHNCASAIQLGSMYNIVPFYFLPIFQFCVFWTVNALCLVIQYSVIIGASAHKRYQSTKIISVRYKVSKIHDYRTNALVYVLK